ncbi:MAG: T9SS type A sorting domain-containing protein, partial [Bacteroidota bacterium]|nr:T9SS type A sorting domain-containing protein [Bacteroidota bacterium]
PITSTFRINKILNAGKFFSVFSLFFFLLFNTAQAQTNDPCRALVVTHNSAWIKYPSCPRGTNGEITLGFSGFMGSYTVRVFMILNQTLVEQPGLRRTNQTASTQTWSNLGPGYYCFLITDNGRGCTETLDIVLFCEELGRQGCTPGFWKNHTDCWQTWATATPLYPDQTVESIFDVPNDYGLDNVTLLEALQGGGGPGLTGAATVLLRAAVAALLNAAHTDVDYPRTWASIIADVNAALASRNRQTMLDLAEALDRDNNSGCSINAHCEAKGEDKSARERTISIADVAAELSVKALPNPSYGAFNVQTEGGSTDKISMRIMDMQGRLVEQRQNVQPNQVLQIGENYSSGTYFVEVLQGAKRKQMKLVKSGN